MYEIIILTLTRSQMYEFITQTCDRTGLWLTIQIGMYHVLASFNIFIIIITESYHLYYMCTRRSNVIIDGIYFWRTSSKNCFTRCSGSCPGFFSLGWAGIASLLKHSGWLSLVIPGYSNSVESIVDVSKFYLSLSSYRRQLPAVPREDNSKFHEFYRSRWMFRFPGTYQDGEGRLI